VAEIVRNRFDRDKKREKRQYNKLQREKEREVTDRKKEM
jgi:hypothetical protein